MKIFFIAFLLVFGLWGSTAFAQCEDPEDINDPECGELIDPDAPLDGGVGFLIGLGTLYGMRRLRKANSL